MSGLAIYDQDKLKPEARVAALSAANDVLAREGVSAIEAVDAATVDLLLAEGLEPDERTEDHFREHGASLRALAAYEAAKGAASTEIRRLDPDNAGFAILFSAAS